jgi:hypothetical protein
MIDVDALQERLAARAAGEALVWSAAHERGDDAEAAARDLLETSPPPLSVTSDTELHELDAIDTRTARRVLAHTLAFALASDERLLEADTAARLADSVIDAFPDAARWWTNGTLGLPGPRSQWTPLTTAAYDTGVIGVSAERVLVVWFMDEDEVAQQALVRQV